MLSYWGHSNVQDTQYLTNRSRTGFTSGLLMLICTVAHPAFSTMSHHMQRSNTVKNSHNWPHDITLFLLVIFDKMDAMHNRHGVLTDIFLSRDKGGNCYLLILHCYLHRCDVPFYSLFLNIELSYYTRRTIRSIWSIQLTLFRHSWIKRYFAKWIYAAGDTCLFQKLILKKDEIKFRPIAYVSQVFSRGNMVLS